MKTLRACLLLMVSILCVHESAFAQKDFPVKGASTAALVDLCQNPDDQDGRSFCFGFGEGVYQTYLARQKPGMRQSICFPEQNGTREEILEKFLIWNKANPQFNTERAAKTLMHFFATNYPCK
jgi:Rap1a immunity proteins